MALSRRNSCRNASTTCCRLVVCVAASCLNRSPSKSGHVLYSIALSRKLFISVRAGEKEGWLMMSSSALPAKFPSKMGWLLALERMRLTR